MYVVIRDELGRSPVIVNEMILDTYVEAKQFCLECQQTSYSNYTYSVRALRKPKIDKYSVVKVTCTPDSVYNYTHKNYETVGVYKTFRSAKDAYRSFDKDRAVDTYFTVEAVYK